MTARALARLTAFVTAFIAVGGCQTILGIEELEGVTSDGGSTAGASGIGGAGSAGTPPSSGTSGLSDSGVGGKTDGASGGAGRPDASGSSACASGSDGGPTPWWRYTNSHGCESAGVPSEMDRPADCDPDTILPPIHLVISRQRWGAVDDTQALKPDENAWKDIGFDFDKRCTNSISCEDSNQVTIKEAACKPESAVNPRDGNNCRDNEIGLLFTTAQKTPSIGPFFGMTEPDWNCEMHRGGFGIMLRISGYNGKKNDRFVRLDLYTTLGLKDPPNWACRRNGSIEGELDPDWYKHAPWLPTKHWRIAQSSIAPDAPDAGSDLPNAKDSDPAAFVRDGYLFAKLPSGTVLQLNGQNTPIPGFRSILHRGILAAQLIEEGTWRLDNGILAGVVDPDETLRGYREIGFCENMCFAYESVRDYLIVHRDALRTTSEILPDTPCDGLTIASDFEARQVTADEKDIEAERDPDLKECPEPRHSGAPRQGCICGRVGCSLADGG